MSHITVCTCMYMHSEHIVRYNACLTHTCTEAMCTVHAEANMIQCMYVYQAWVQLQLQFQLWSVLNPLVNYNYNYMTFKYNYIHMGFSECGYNHAFFCNNKLIIIMIS